MYRTSLRYVYYFRFQPSYKIMTENNGGYIHEIRCFWRFNYISIQPVALQGIIILFHLNSGIANPLDLPCSWIRLTQAWFSDRFNIHWGITIFRVFVQHNPPKYLLFSTLAILLGIRIHLYLFKAQINYTLNPTVMDLTYTEHDQVFN